MSSIKKCIGAGLSIVLLCSFGANAYAAGTSACPSLSQTLQQGASDTSTSPAGQVSQLQTFLANYFGLNQADIVSGYFGPTTKTYVVKFQTQQGINPVGSVGPQTRAQISRVCGGATVSVQSNPVSTAQAGDVIPGE